MWDLKEIQFVRLLKAQPGYHARNITFRFHYICNIVVFYKGHEQDNTYISQILQYLVTLCAYLLHSVHIL